MFLFTFAHTMSAIPGVTFATFGCELKVFGPNGKGGFEERAVYNTGYTPGNKSRQLSWASDGVWLAAPSDDSAFAPVLKFENSKKLTRMRLVPNVNVAVFMTYTNRNLAIASESGAVLLWDVKQKSVYKTLCAKGPEPVNFLDVSWDDNFVAACGSYSESPAVKIYGVTTSRLMHTLPLDSPSQFSGLRFSPVKKNTLACTTLEGQIVVWDVHKAAVIMDRKDAHIGSCTGLAMSLVNHTILATITMGGMFQLHDVRSKSEVGHIPTQCRLTSVDLVRETPHVLMSTADGRVLLYDLRTSQKICEIQAHTGNVECLRVFQGLANMKPIEELHVNTPEEAPKHNPALEMSVADVCTPPSTVHSAVPKSAAGKALSTLDEDATSPILPIASSNNYRSSSGAAHSTPNPIAESQSLANRSDSFLKLIASPVGASPFRTLQSPRPTSTLSFSAGHGFRSRQIMLNGIREEQERVSSPLSEAGPPSLNGCAVSLPSTPKTHPADIEALREIIREEVREEMNDLRSFFTEQLQGIRHELERLRIQSAENHKQAEKSFLRNREHIIYTYQTVGHLANVINISKVLGEFDHDPLLFREDS